MILDLFRLDGKVALVTGAAQGIGRGIAAALAGACADVVALDRLPLDGCLDEIATTGRRGHGVTLDLSGMTPERAREVVADSVARAGRLDILVNNAGIIRRAAALDYPADDWEAVLDIDLSGAFYLSQAAARHFTAAEQPGKIINMVSMLAFQGGILTPAYAAAKSGLAGLTRALANEWAAQGINVNALAPGYLATDVTAALRADPARSQAILARIPAGRWGEPSDVAGAAVFLASSASDYIHGAILPIDGGWLAR